MAGILSGKIRWADLNPARGNKQTVNRPVMILSPIRALSVERIGIQSGEASSEEMIQAAKRLLEFDIL